MGDFYFHGLVMLARDDRFENASVLYQIDLKRREHLMAFYGFPVLQAHFKNMGIASAEVLFPLLMADLAASSIRQLYHQSGVW